MSKSYLGDLPTDRAKPRRRAFLYCRISQDREGRRLGVDRQQDDGDRLADRLGCDIVEVFIENDIGASTRSKKPRPEFERMLALAAAGAADVILASTSARLTRRPMEGERLIQLYERHGIVTHYANAADNDLSTARGRSRARQDAAKDAEEAEEIGERVELDVLRRARAGLPHGGNRAFGWTKEGDLDSYEHPYLVQVADRALAGESIKSLGLWLYEEAVPQVRWHPPLVLKPWPYQVVRKMITNPRVAGLRTHKNRIVGAAVWPAAIDESKWRQLIALFGDPARSSGGSAGRVNLLTGQARCDACDLPIGISNSSSKTRGRRVRYHCEPCGIYREMTQVDTYVIGAVIEVLRHYHEEAAQADPEVLKNVERLRARIEATKMEFAGDDTVTPQELREMLRHLRGRLQAEEAKLNPSRRHMVVEGVTGPIAAAAWSSLPLDRRRAIIDALVEVRIRRALPGRKVFDPDSVVILRKD